MATVERHLHVPGYRAAADSKIARNRLLETPNNPRSTFTADIVRGLTTRAVYSQKLPRIGLLRLASR